MSIKKKLNKNWLRESLMMIGVIALLSLGAAFIPQNKEVQNILQVVIVVYIAHRITKWLEKK